MVSSGKLCEKCIDRRIAEHDDTKRLGGNHSILWQGLVTEAITSKYIFGGSEWLKDAALYGISQEGLEQGIAAHNDAVKGLNGVPPLPDMSAMVKKEVTDPPPKKEKKIKAKEVAPEPPEPAEHVEEVKPVKKPSKIKLVKALAQTSVLEAINQPVATEPPLVVAPPPQTLVKRAYKKKVVTSAALPPPIAILSEEKPVEVDNVETIEVIARELNGTNYYLDTRKSKVYNPKNGSYVGRWDSVTEKIITTIADSDHEA